MWTLGIAHWLPQSRGFGCCWTSLVTEQPDRIQGTSIPAEKEKKKEKEKKYWIVPARYRLRSHSHENWDQLDKPHWGVTIYINAHRMSFVD